MACKCNGSCGGCQPQLAGYFTTQGQWTEQKAAGLVLAAAAIYFLGGWAILKKLVR